MNYKIRFNFFKYFFNLLYSKISQIYDEVIRDNLHLLYVFNGSLFAKDIPYTLYPLEFNKIDNQEPIKPVKPVINIFFILV